MDINIIIIILNVCPSMDSKVLLAGGQANVLALVLAIFFNLLPLPLSSRPLNSLQFMFLCLPIHPLLLPVPPILLLSSPPLHSLPHFPPLPNPLLRPLFHTHANPPTFPSHSPLLPQFPLHSNS